MGKRMVFGFIIIGLALGIGYVLHISDDDIYQTLFKSLLNGDIEAVKNYLLSFGAWAPIVSFLLMILAVLIAPIPAFVPTFVNGLLFGSLYGALLSWVSALVGAVLSFYIAQKLGRPFVEKFASKKALDWTNDFFDRFGMHSILVARVFPIASYGIVSYAAGLTAVRLRTYIIATAIGQTPATFLYSYLGENAVNSVWVVFLAFLLVIVMVILGVFLKKLIDHKKFR